MTHDCIIPGRRFASYSFIEKWATLASLHQFFPRGSHSFVSFLTLNLSLRALRVAPNEPIHYYCPSCSINWIMSKNDRHWVHPTFHMHHEDVSRFWLLRQVYLPVSRYFVNILVFRQPSRLSVAILQLFALCEGNDGHLLVCLRWMR
jgi:hypothetical protein